MSKFRIESPTNTPLDPQAFEKQFVKPDLNNSTPFSGVNEQLQFVAPDKVDEGYGTMGNSGYAVQVINEAKAANQGFWEITGKGIGNVAKTIGIEVGKTPGYVGGLIGAGANEVFGDGKNSMSLIVDNAWVNAFESLDQNIKEAMPLYISQSVQEGNLLDKLGSGEWWATAGADGLGFMLSMFVPGAAVKALGVGAKIARVGEGLANLAPRIGKAMTGAGLVENAGELGFAYTKAFARNAGGYASAAVNTAIESSAEAANTFDNVKSKYINEGLSEEEASMKAGEAASAVFKGNMALLAVSNVLDEIFIWKTIGSAGQKEAAQSMLSKVFKDGNVDMDALKNIGKEFTRAKVLSRTAKNFGKNVVKEGFYEEGSQTTLQQNVEEGKIKDSVLGSLSDVVSSYFDDFSNNTELHESIFLGGLLGGGASIVGTVQENRALKQAIQGGEARTKENSPWVKYGILPETKAQKGLGTILHENHIQQFRSYKDLLDTNEDGTQTLNEQKLVDANLEQIDRIRDNILYDLAVAQGDKLEQEIYGQMLAANYVGGFLGQEGSKELFQDHAKNHVLPAWKSRFLETFGREATEQESQNYLQNFKESGERVIDAYTSAEETNYPERYYQEPTKEYQDFKQKYFHDKFQTLVTLDSLRNRKNAIMSDMTEAGVTELDLEELDKIENPVKKINAEIIRNDLKKWKATEEVLNTQYTKFFTKEGVKQMFEAFKNRKEQFQKIEQEVLKENQELKDIVNSIPDRNALEIAELRLEAPIGNVRFKAKDGSTYNINDLPSYTGDIQSLGLVFDDVSNEEYDSFVDTSKVSAATLKKIAQRMINKQPLSERENAIRLGATAELEGIFQEEAKRIQEQLAQQEPQSQSEDTQDYNEVDQAVDSVYKKKGVNLYPSTGRNLQNEVEEIKPGVFAEKLTPKPSQKLWFEVLDKEVRLEPSSYTVQVVRLDDNSNPELQKQLQRDSDPADQRPGDLYTVLYKDGKPVIKGNSSNKEDIERRRQEELNTIQVKEDESIKRSTKGTPINQDSPNGFKVGDKFNDGMIVTSEQTVLDDNYDPKIADNEGRGYEVIDRVMEYGEMKDGKLSKAPKIRVRIFNNKTDADTYFEKQSKKFAAKRGTGLHFDKVNTKYDAELANSTQGNYVFTGLWRPESLYPVKNGKPSKFVLAESTILDNFLLHVKLPGLVLNNISKNQKDHLSRYGVTDFSEQGVMTAAFFHAKQEYTEWYNELQNNPGQLQVAGVTKGHTVKMYSDANKANPIWGNPLNGIPGLKLVNDSLIGGKFEMSTTGTIQIEDELFKIPQGDVVIVDSNNNVHPIRARNLSENEVQTVLYLLSLRTQEGPTESIKLKAPEPVQFGNIGMKEVPVFFNINKKNQKPRMNIIESLISFGTRNGGKGEIYFPKGTVGTKPLLVFTDFNGVTQNIDVQLIKDAVDTNDFNKIQPLVDFLNQKRFNINEHLLLNNNTFSKPKLVYKRDEAGKQIPELEWDQTRSYYDHLLNDVVSTTTQQLDGYPSRVQRNLWFNKQPLENLGDFQSVTEEPQMLPAGKDALTMEEIMKGLENEKISDYSKKSSKEKVMDKIRNKKSLDDFRGDMDKILTTSDLLKQKIQSGEIIQKCK